MVCNMSENIENLTQQLELLDLKHESKIIQIIINENVLTCESDVLKEKSKYFEAFLNIAAPAQEELEIKGGIEENALKVIIDFFNGVDLKLSLANFQDVLQGIYNYSQLHVFFLLIVKTGFRDYPSPLSLWESLNIINKFYVPV